MKFAYSWDETISVGSLITAYDKGYHIVVSVDYREASDEDEDDEVRPPIIKYQRVVKESGEVVTQPGKILSCDAAYCRRITKERAHNLCDREMRAAQRKLANLLEYASD